MADELAAQLRQTQAFINTRPVTLTLTPHTLAADGSGGQQLTAGIPRDPQVFRFIEVVSLRSDRRVTDVGEQYMKDATLLGMPDAVIAPQDTFEWSGYTWTVMEIEFPNGYEVRALVSRYGR